MKRRDGRNLGSAASAIVARHGHEKRLPEVIRFLQGFHRRLASRPSLLWYSHAWRKVEEDKLSRKLLFNAAYLSLAFASYAWLLINYSGASLIIASIVFLGLVYLLASVAAIVNLISTNRPPNRTTTTALSLQTQKIIRWTALILPIPAIGFCSLVLLCAFTYDKSPGALDRFNRVHSLELDIFQKSFLWNYLVLPKMGLPFPNMGEYVDDLYSSMPAETFFYDGSKSTIESVAVSIRVDQSGSTSALKIAKSSGNSATDQEALETIGAIPFKPLPKEENALSCDYTDFTFTFKGKHLQSTEEASPSPDPNFIPVGGGYYIPPAVSSFY